MNEMKETRQLRVKSPVFWSALFAQILSLFVFTGVIDIHVSGTIQNTICAVLELFVTFGILNNPTNGDAL